ncbi:MAG: helix-turn-helix transcriptional regulator [Labilithrix sp.]|nr:helix-turn-helix transcriptional regulator [Labilithrix sp.]
MLHAVYDHPVALGAYERRLLTRIALHLENGQRVRRRPESVIAEVTASGRVIHREADAPPETLLEARVARVREARTRRRRTSGDALELWSALVCGRASLAPRVAGNELCYLVLDNPPATHALRALSPSEIAVLSLASRGLSTKLVAYGLGITPSTVSARLASAAAKVGSLSRSDLVRTAALLAGDPRAELAVDALTVAERDILALLQRGLSNAQIARLRSRSVRTIANQVASLLRKTGSASRRALVVRSERAVASAVGAEG